MIPSIFTNRFGLDAKFAYSWYRDRRKAGNGIQTAFKFATFMVGCSRKHAKETQATAQQEVA